MKTTKNKKRPVGAKNSKEIAAALGIDSETDIALMEYKASLSAMAAKVIENSGLTPRSEFNQPYFLEINYHFNSLD